MDDNLLINNPLALVTRLFGPDRPFLLGEWTPFANCATIYYIEDEGDDDALDVEGELRPQEE
jgi:hypothetical protein